MSLSRKLSGEDFDVLLTELAIVVEAAKDLQVMFNNLRLGPIPRGHVETIGNAARRMVGALRRYEFAD